MIEYVVGPLVAALISLKYTDYRVKKQEKIVEALGESITQVIQLVEKTDKEALRKTMVLLTPVSQAVKQLQQEVGIQ